MSLRLYDRNNRLICRFPVSLGSHYGDKQELGDLKTPEGEFYIVQIQRASHWMYNSGKENIKGYYGNWFIRLNTKYSGIGIHDTHELECIGERATEGSIRLSNTHLDRLRTMIDVGMAVRIESSQLDLESDGKNVKEVAIPTIVAETAQPIINQSATHSTEKQTNEVITSEPATTAKLETTKRTESAKPAEKKANKNDEWHTVVDGDLVGRIASQYGITVADIKRLNPGINVDRISIGQMIRIKGEPEPETTTVATQTATQTAPEEQKRVESEVWHTVVDGDLVGRIASQYGTTTSRIKELNPDLNPDRISIGQRIRVKERGYLY
jgi:LysM repeat protein